MGKVFLLFSSSSCSSSSSCHSFSSFFTFPAYSFFSFIMSFLPSCLFFFFSYFSSSHPSFLSSCSSSLPSFHSSLYFLSFFAELLSLVIGLFCDWLREWASFLWWFGRRSEENVASFLTPGSRLRSVGFSVFWSVFSAHSVSCSHSS